MLHEFATRNYLIKIVIKVAIKEICDQGDQIWLFFAYWVIDFFGQLLKITEVSPFVLLFGG
jgi:hypothetical protein